MSGTLKAFNKQWLQLLLLGLLLWLFSFLICKNACSIIQSTPNYAPAIVTNKTDKVLAVMETSSDSRDTDNDQVWMNNIILESGNCYEEKHSSESENGWLKMGNYCKFYNQRQVSLTTTTKKHLYWKVKSKKDQPKKEWGAEGSRQRKQQAQSSCSKNTLEELKTGKNVSVTAEQWGRGRVAEIKSEEQERSPTD